MCFDVDDFESGFYFTVQDIKECIGIEKLEIPTKISSRYKAYLCQQGYYDFKPYFSLLKKELQFKRNEQNHNIN